MHTGSNASESGNNIKITLCHKVHTIRVETKPILSNNKYCQDNVQAD